MKKKGWIKRLFPGGNTPTGFYSYFDHIIDLKSANRLFLIKGGPGVGKSHLMKKIGHQMVAEGYDVEFHHCSADPDSVDAAYIPELKVALIDGTAPHVIDPKYPGAIDEIINLGECWIEDKMVANRESIMRSIDENGKIYKRVYKYLAAAKLIHDDVEWVYGQAMDFEKLSIETNQWMEKLLKGVKPKKRLAKERHLFGSALTYQGHIDHSDTFISPIKKIHYIKGAPGTGKSTILLRLAARLAEKGYDLELYHEPMEPEKLEAVIAPQLELAVTTNSRYYDNLSLDLDQYLNVATLEKYKDELMESERVYTYLMDNVFCNLKKTKVNHDEIETYYIPNIDFSKVDVITENIVERILRFK